MRPLLIAALCSVMPACTPATAPSDPTPALPDPEAPSVGTELVPESTAPVVDAVPLSAIGYASAPEISGKARTKNRAALKLHRAKDYLRSRAGFEEALELSPDHDMARFNLACALTRLGKLEEARTELKTVLHRDLFRFQGRWRGARADSDLEGLRTSTHAAELDALVDELRDTYETAHDRGVAAYLYPRYPSPAQTDFAGNHVAKGSSSLIAGAWLHEAGRFVPLARGGTVALLDLPRRRQLRADVGLDEQHCGWDVYASATLVSTDPDPAAKPPGRAYDGASEPQENEYAPPDTPSLRIVDEPESLIPTWIDVQPHGGVYRVAPPEGYVISRRRLSVPGRDTPFPLGGKYETIFVTTDTNAPVFLLARRASSGFSESDIVFDATVSRLDLNTGKVERITHGPGNAWVSIGPDDAVYIESNDHVQRWATAHSDTPEPTMPGLHITMPYGGPDCMCCG